MRQCLSALVGLVLVACCSSVTAAQPPGPSEAPAATQEAQKPAAPSPPVVKAPAPVRTSHTARINGQTISYTATTGHLTLEDEAGKAKANVFFIAYTRDGVDDEAARPVTFSFNGGPGSSSVWMHLGLLGPKRVEMGDAGALTPPPYGVVDNEHSVLDVTDLVFIDPVSTGYSRAAAGESARQFHGVREDVESVGEFIRLWTTRYERWASPKFLIGESYGTTRAAGLAGHLQQRHGMFLNGIMLVSSVLNFQTILFDVGNDLPHIVYVPTYAATAWYHKQLPPELQQRPVAEVVDEARRFALGEYATALLAGNTLSASARTEVAGTLARFTGLSADYIARANLRPTIMGFVKELRRDERVTVGRLDSRFTGLDRDATGVGWEYDPSMSAIMGPYTGALNAYVRGDLKYENDVPYEILTGRVQPWSYGEAQNRYVNVAETLRSAMAQNPHLRVHVANGYYDLATPFGGTEWTFSHLAFDGDYTSRVEMKYYEAGHMMYVHPPSLAAQGRDLRQFITSTLSTRQERTNP
jgi:carboxypeptidase C (cathepsin A)